MFENLNLVHICQDEKFTDGAYHVFNKAFPNQNVFVVLKPPANPPIKYIKKITNYRELIMDKDLIGNFHSLVHKADLIVLHGLNHPKPHLVKNFPFPEKFLWLALGADIYQNPYIYPNEIYGKLTAELKNKLSAKFSLLKEIKKMYRKYRYGINNNNDANLKLAEEVAPKIRYFASFQKEQFDLLYNKDLLYKDATFQHFSFYPLDFIISDTLNDSPKANNILLGNSASFTNNHLEAINILGDLNFENRKIFAPLSYGNPSYAKEIIDYGRSTLGDSLIPLLNFMPLKEYNTVLQSCGIVIMNHYRGQAAGNILSTLYSGSKVYLSENNLIYHYLKRIGCFVYSIEKDLTPSNPIVFRNLNNEQIAVNKKLLKTQISEKVLVEELKSGVGKYLKKEIHTQNHL